MKQQDLLYATYNDDRPRVARLLRTDPRLAVFNIQEPKLYEGQILHWIYAGDTPLHLASAGLQGRSKTIKALICAGANIHARDNFGQISLMLLCKQKERHRDGLIEGVNALIAAGADVNAQSKPGYTALMMATTNNNINCVKALLAAQADPSLIDGEGDTALKDALSSNYKEIAHLLQDALGVMRSESIGPCGECGSPDMAQMRSRGLDFSIGDITATYRCPACDGILKLSVRQMNSIRGIDVMCHICKAVSHVPPSVWCSKCGTKPIDSDKFKPLGGLSDNWRSRIFLRK